MFNYTPSEYIDYSHPDPSQPHHPAHPDYLQHHPAPIVSAAIAVIVAAIKEEGIAA